MSRAIHATDSRPRLSATPSGSTTASPSASATSKTSSPNAASPSRTSPSGTGARPSALAYARRLRRRAGPVGDTWHLDELFVTIRGQRQYLWRAVDQDGEVIDILLQPRRDRHAAARFFRKLLKRSGRVPHRLVTDRLGSYRAAHRVIMPSVVHDTTRYANNRAEVSHQPTRQRERHMRRFKSVAQAQRFLAVHDVVRNLFTVGRHQLRAGHQRLLRSRAFVTWNAVAAA